MLDKYSRKDIIQSSYCYEGSKIYINKFDIRDLVKGFKSQKGSVYNAYIILKEDNSTGFEFENK